MVTEIDSEIDRIVTNELALASATWRGGLNDSSCSITFHLTCSQRLDHQYRRPRQPSTLPIFET